MREVIDNLREFLLCLKSLSIAESADLGNGNFCVATGIKSATENWVFYDSADFNSKIISSVKSFFYDRELKYIWPILNYNGNFRLLEDEGLRLGGGIIGMKFNIALKDANANYLNSLNKVRFNLYFEILDAGSGEAEIDDWARTAWQGFDGKRTPKKFLAMARELAGNNKIKLVKAILNNESVGTFLLCEDNANMGVYYFAVPPKFRRKRIAAVMMEKVLELAELAGKDKIVLQATREGEKFYKSFGFEYARSPVITLYTNARY